MMKTEEALFVRAAGRLGHQSGRHRSLQAVPADQGVGNLVKFYDDVLNINSHLSYPADKHYHLVIIPVAGVVGYNVSGQRAKFALPGEVVSVSLPVDSRIEFVNNERSAMNNFLHLWFRGDDLAAMNVQAAFDVDSSRNQLMSLFNHAPSQTQAFIGQYDGRVNAIYPAKMKSVFVFVLEGAFEVQNRLMEPRDSLIINDCHELEFEALSNNAIILIISPGY